MKLTVAADDVTPVACCCTFFVLATVDNTSYKLVETVRFAPFSLVQRVARLVKVLSELF